ncbi:inorganic pyrophosphatase [Rhodococcus sp. SGAir0479]|uniref:inorganic pyrophosphatase n=1 Tax=Rhodococcus sp. SGAir0479 TaxID=2567884 RepID=UPI0010CCB926|nr:inorganic pyrophosphatase [Rhodococcus sp. SGAir0479]QCQ92308.1 inorganic pyrophosphatase [Rhodococcus sp. SGAir0479]
MTNLAAFFTALDELVRKAPLRIDRPQGSAHPRFPDIVYPLDYGYLEETAGGDGEGVDVFRGSVDGAGVVGVALTADLTKRDVEVKVLLDCSDGEIELVEHFLRERVRLNSAVVRRA